MNLLVRWVGLLVMLPWVLAAAPPDVALRDTAGASHRIGEYVGRGQWTVVAVWSVDCAICQREMFHMAFFHDEHKEKDARVLGLSVDSVAELARIKEFIAQHGLSFPNVIGSRADVGVITGEPLKGTPTYLFYSPKGKLVAQRAGAMTQDDVEQLIARATVEKKTGK